MKKTLFAGLAVGVIMLGITVNASATTIFSDNFNTENGGVGVLNYAGFANWGISNGTVDLIGNAFHDFLPGNGLYVDMDGSTNDAGKMLSSQTFVLSAGNYFLQYDLAGNHRNSSGEIVSIAVNTGISTVTRSLYQSLPFTTFTDSFSLNGTTSVTISFEGVGGDNIGMLLDNVRLEKVDPVPEPATMLLMGTGLAGLIGARRKKKA